MNFQDIGKYAGDVVRGIALAFLALGQTLGTVAASIETFFEDAFDAIKNHTKQTFVALGLAATGDLVDAYKVLNLAPKGQTGIVDEEVAKQKAIYATLRDSIKEDTANLFPDAAEEARRKKARIANLRPDEGDTTPEQPIVRAPRDAAAKAELSLEEKMLQDQLAIHRAYAKETESAEKEMYDAGLISLTEYFGRRKAAAHDRRRRRDRNPRARARRSLWRLRRSPAPRPRKQPAGISGQRQAPGRGNRRQGKSRGARHQNHRGAHQGRDENPHARHRAGQSRARKPAADSRVREATRRAPGKTAARPRAPKSKPRRRSARCRSSQGSGSAAQQGTAHGRARAVEEAQARRRRLRPGAAKTRAGHQGVRDREADAFRTRPQAGQISKLEEEKQINQLIKDRLPLLQADAAAETGAAAKTGNVDLQAEASQGQAGVDKLTVSVKDLGKTARRRASPATSRTFFKPSAAARRASRNRSSTWPASVIQSIEQMLMKLLL